MDQLNHQELMAYLNQQTGKITWQELQPYFAKGSLLALQSGFDMIEIAMSLIQDDKTTILPLIEGQVLGQLNDLTAQSLQPNDAFWGLVVAPWVLIQPIAALN